MDMTTIIVGIVALAIGAVVSYFLAKKSVNKENHILVDNAKRKADELISDAEKEGEAIKKEKIFQAKEKFLELKSAHEEAINHRERKFAESESKLKEREDKLKLHLSELQRQRELQKK